MCFVCGYHHVWQCLGRVCTTVVFHSDTVGGARVPHNVAFIHVNFS